MVAGLVTASRKRVRRRGLAIAAVGWGAAITAAAVAPNIWLEYAALVFVGYGSISFNSLVKTALQLAAAPAMRGRVMALWAVAWQGSTPIGGPIVGWVGEELGGRWGLVVGGLPTIAVGIAAYPILARVDRQRAERRASAAATEPAIPTGADEPDSTEETPIPAWHSDDDDLQV